MKKQDIAIRIINNLSNYVFNNTDNPDDFLKSVHEYKYEYLKFSEKLDNMKNLMITSVYDDIPEFKNFSVNKNEIIYNKANSFLCTKNLSNFHKRIFNNFIKLYNRESNEKISKELQHETTTYMNNVISALSNEVDTPGKKVPLRLYQSTMLNETDKNARQIMYQASVTRNRENIPIIKKIISLRNEFAVEQSYKSYAEYKLATDFSTNVDNIKKFLDQVVSIVKPFAVKELSFIKKHFQDNDILPSDLAYYINKYNTENKEKDSNKNETYKLEHALSFITEKFGVNFVESEPPKSDTDFDTFIAWQKLVKYYKVFENEKLIAGLYLDLNSRESKINGGYSGKLGWKSTTDIPIGIIVLNIPEEMSMYDYKNLLHEFGHTLQHILSDQTEYEVSGFNLVDWTFIEVPSQTLEKFCTLKNNQTQNNELFFINALRQIYLSYCDILIHDNVSLEDAVSYCNKNFTVVDPLPDQNELTYFTHLFNDKFSEYASGYYGYLFSDIISEHCFDLLKSDNKNFQKFRNTILSKGGSKSSEEIIKDFLQQEPDINHWVSKHLCDKIHG